MEKEAIIQKLFDQYSEIRYVAIYLDNDLIYRQRKEADNSSSGETDRFEELLVNPTLLTLASQRGNIDCGGLKYIIVGYGNFFQLVKAVPKGHLSICVEKNSDLTTLPESIFTFLKKETPFSI